TASIPPICATAASTMRSPQTGSSRSTTHLPARGPIASATTRRLSASRSASRSWYAPVSGPCASSSPQARATPLAAPVITTFIEPFPSVGDPELFHQFPAQLELLDLGSGHRPFVDEADMARDFERGEPLPGVGDQLFRARLGLAARLHISGRD